MKKAYIFAIPHKKEGYCIDARNPYTWEEVGTIVFDGEPSEAAIMEARRASWESWLSCTMAPSA